MIAGRSDKWPYLTEEPNAHKKKNRVASLPPLNLEVRWTIGYVTINLLSLFAVAKILTVIDIIITFASQLSNSR